VWPIRRLLLLKETEVLLRVHILIPVLMLSVLLLVLVSHRPFLFGKQHGFNISFVHRIICTCGNTSVRIVRIPVRVFIDAFSSIFGIGKCD
jgi:hypothetical protein